ncbi:MAG: 6-phospho-beta-glucosidase [Pseudonocardiales bacterium]|nr:6-phospho-beta-glucosidase [Pseudonocardiales bacterium]
MKLAILGGGGFRVPLVYSALLGDPRPGGVTEFVLYDTNIVRRSVIATVLGQQAASRAPVTAKAPEVLQAPSLEAALRDADFVFCAIRVGGVRARTVDERVAMELGLLGQETVGAGGIAYGLRTIPAVIALARRIAELAPRAWVINFTNPAGLVTEAMQQVLGDRVIGICDSPSGLCRRAASALGVDPELATFDYAGLNHLGWLRAVSVDGVELLPRLLADDAALESFEEGRLFGADWLRSLGAIPNEYLHYYYFHREAVQAASRAATTRGEFLQTRQDEFYASLQEDSSGALRQWQRVRAERDATYMAETRSAGERDEREMAAGGYEQVALQLMRALAHDERANLIVNVRNSGLLSHLDDEAVIEVPCTITSSGPQPLPVSRLSDHQAGLVCAVKAVERSVIEAARTGSRTAAVRAFAEHPLVDSVSVARQLVAAYQRRLPELGYLR